MTGDLRAHPGWSPTHAARDLAPETTGTWGDLSTPENQTNTCPECQHPAGDHTRTGMLAFCHRYGCGCILPQTATGVASSALPIRRRRKRPVMLSPLATPVVSLPPSTSPRQAYTNPTPSKERSA